MGAMEKFDLVGVEDYLAGELVSTVKHEYLGGVVHAMAGGRNRHNAIASNILVALGKRLSGRKCRAYNSDTKIRLRLPAQVRFYYPDVSVVCRSNPPGDTFQDQPNVIVEVISEKTRRTDEGEKKDAYLRIPSLDAYLIVEQEDAAIIVYRRAAQGFEREVHTGMDAVIPLPTIEAELPLAEAYEAVEFGPDPESQET
jgi:Uma2 family endonuclease